jgi:endonuclease/exonuclease/phosphatase family metal-dependent hydrolase
MHGRVCFNNGRVRQTFAAVLTMIGLAAVPAAAQTTKTLSAEDATLRGGSYANTTYGSSTTLETRASDDASYRRQVLMKFDTHNTIPAGATIASAKLVLTVKGGNADARRIGAYCVPRSFTESAVTWKKRKSSYYWNTPGGDTAHFHASTSVNNTAGSKVTWDITSEVQEVVRKSSSRYTRVLLIDLDGPARSSYKQYYSSEAGTSSLRPKLVVTYGGGSTSTSSSTTEPAPAPSSGGSTLKVMDWNIHHGVDTGGRNNLDRVASWIAKINPHVVSLNEVEKQNGYNNNADEPAVLKSLLKSKTGVTWYSCFAHRSGGTNGQGNLVLSRLPIQSCDDHLLSYDRSVARATVSVNGRTVNVFSTHLDDASSSRRTTQISQLKNYASGVSEQRVVMGDFNAWPGAGEISGMTSSYYDAWASAKAAGTAVAYPGNDAGNTRNSRIDYIFESKGATGLSLQKAQVYDTGSISDHRPVSATFSVK